MRRDFAGRPVGRDRVINMFHRARAVLENLQDAAHPVIEREAWDSMLDELEGFAGEYIHETADHGKAGR